MIETSGGVELGRERKKEWWCGEKRDEMHVKTNNVVVDAWCSIGQVRQAGVWLRREIKRASATSTWSAILP